MPEKKIPCADCDAEKKKIEDAGDREVIRCEPILGEPGWCTIEWKYKE